MFGKCLMIMAAQSDGVLQFVMLDIVLNRIGELGSVKRNVNEGHGSILRREIACDIQNACARPPVAGRKKAWRLEEVARLEHAQGLAERTARQLTEELGALKRQFAQKERPATSLQRGAFCAPTHLHVDREKIPRSVKIMRFAYVKDRPSHRKNRVFWGSNCSTFFSVEKPSKKN